MLTVNGDGAVVERQLAGGDLVCPSCGGVLGGWGNGRPRRVRGLGRGRAGSWFRAGRGAGCGATHVLLLNRPGFCGGSQSTGEWDDGSSTEVSGRAA